MSDRFRLPVAQVARLAMVAVLIFVFVPAVQSGPAKPLDSANLLTNGGFETNTSGFLAAEWTAWPGSGDTAPEYYTSTMAHSGERSQQVKKAAHIHDGGFYQKVSTGITMGDAVSFGIWHN